MQRVCARRTISWIVRAAAATLLIVTYTEAQTESEDISERGAPLFNDLGDHQCAISTSSSEAQKYFKSRSRRRIAKISNVILKTVGRCMDYSPVGGRRVKLKKRMQWRSVFATPGGLRISPSLVELLIATERDTVVG